MNPIIAPHTVMVPRSMSSILMVVAVITCVLLYYAYVPKHIIVLTTSYASEVTRAKIATYATPERMAKVSLSGVYSDVKKMVPSLCDVTLSYSRPCSITMYVATARPCAVINNEQILTLHGSLVPLEDYGPHVVEQLPRITVAEQFFCEESRIRCSKWIQNVPLKILESFSIVWYARSHIELLPRNKDLFGLVVITWCYTNFLPEMMAAMERVAQKNKRIDMRVPHYAIVSPILRGNL